MKEISPLQGPFVCADTPTSIENIIVMLHGYGSNGQDLIQIGNQWKNQFPKFCFSAPNAPLNLNKISSSYMWFDVYPEGIPIDQASEKQKLKTKNDFIKSCELLEQHIYFLSEKYNLSLNKFFLLGFSQGSMMSIEVGSKLKESIAGIISLSGRVYTEDFNQINRNKSPVLVVHGDKDDIIKVHRFEETCQILEKSGYNIEKHLIKNMGHTINYNVIEICKNFVSIHM